MPWYELLNIEAETLAIEEISTYEAEWRNTCLRAKREPYRWIEYQTLKSNVPEAAWRDKEVVRLRQKVTGLIKKNQSLMFRVRDLERLNYQLKVKLELKNNNHRPVSAVLEEVSGSR